MSVQYRVNITAEALADIQAIFDYIEQSSPQNAATTVERMLDAVDSLDTLPSRYKVVGRSRRTGSRVHSLVIRPFIIYYRVEEGPQSVFILTIRHGAQIQPKRFQ